MSTTKAPTLFGKRMVWDATRGEWYTASIAVIKAGPFVHSWGELVAGTMRKRWRFTISSQGTGMGDGSFFTQGPIRASAQAAANDAERYLRRLHRALGKVVGHEGE